MMKTEKKNLGRPAGVTPFKVTPLNLDPNKVKEFREICKERGISLSEAIRKFIDKELEKQEKNVMGLINPLNIPYSAATTTTELQYTKRQTLISSFSNYSTVHDAFKELKDARLTVEDINNLNRCYINLGEGLRQIRANLIAK